MTNHDSPPRRSRSRSPVSPAGASNSPEIVTSPINVTDSPEQALANPDAPEVPASVSDAETRTLRARGRFRELNTIPEGIVETRAAPDARGRPLQIMANFIALQPMSGRNIYQYRVDFEPNIESVPLRRKIFREAIKTWLPKETTYDGWSDARSTKKAAQDTISTAVPHPHEPESQEPFKVIIRLVGEVLWGSSEMLRVYNMNMKNFLRNLGYFQAAQPGAYLHQALAEEVGHNLMTIGGYRTATNTHKGDRILMNLESVHKLVQKRNVFELMVELRRRNPPNLQEALKLMLIGKLVITSYSRKEVYKIEDINFTMTPSSTFRDDKNDCDVSFKDYYKRRYDITVRDANQPLLVVVQNNKSRRSEREGEASKQICLIPELCNIAGLTEEQRNDNQIKRTLITSSQIAPHIRVERMYKFLKTLHDSKEVAESLEGWGYSFEKDPLKIKGRQLPVECIGVGAGAAGPKDKWPKVDNMGGFEQAIMHNRLAVAPRFPKLRIIIPTSVARGGSERDILDRIRDGFTKVGLCPGDVDTVHLSGDNPQLFAQALRSLGVDITAALIVMPRQNKECYDAIKKIATGERGLVTQVVTAKLMTDDRKARGAAVKIGIQVAAKIGGEPWFIDLPIPNSMVCGYDTYHDTAKRGRSFGAFVASMNHKYSRWFSKADTHDAIEELSAQLAANFGQALKAYRELNGKFPDRVFLYRDGVGDGNLDHVFNVELEQTKKAIEELGASVKLTVIIVNKRVGARFYMRNANAQPPFVNPPPGSVIDDYVTRRGRYDFYLISQSTRNGSVAPTYYNVIFDESALSPDKLQMMAFKLCFAYYNWTGTVRVPAPCQYAHKLAYLCGEHLHREPNALLNDKLHFL